MKLHPRTLLVEKARGEFRTFMHELEELHELTYGEVFSLLGNYIADLAKYQIRGERHPDDPDKKGDEA